MESAMTERRIHHHDRCHFCGITRPAWLPVPQEPDGEMFPAHHTLGLNIYLKLTMSQSG